MKNNKGFTLVELLAVIIILSSIALVAVASVTSSLARRDDKECDEQIELVKNAAKIYFSMNDSATCSEKPGTKCVKVSTLKSGEYLNSKDKTDRLQDNDYVYISGNRYEFSDNDRCTTS